MSGGNSYLPSIWLADFCSKAQFDARASALGAQLEVMAAIDDRMLQSRHPFDIKAWCAACHAVTTMRVSWHYCGTNGQGSVHPAWTETCACNTCGLNSRMRALVDFLFSKLKANPASHVYMAEQITTSFTAMKKLFADVTGSEYLGPDYRPGETAAEFKGHAHVRHEDLSNLSFPDGTFDLVVTQDVFEHIPDYQKTFSESARVLKAGGSLVFTIPFFYDQATTCIRATVDAQGTVQHILPPEFHGNPVSNEGSLCFQNFGWDLLDALRIAGLVQPQAHMYWGPWAGHIGFPFFVFSAHKALVN
ncbi:MAG: class I SAM-dependent methyltransferase [Rhodoferax sp.]|nr:class I SAM-dependent methyltransferase [Rhodoferax sp.]